MSLTDLQIKRLKAPDKGQKTYYDSALPGFGVRVSQGGTKTFVVLYGKDRRRRSLGRYPDLSLSEARLLAKQAQVDITLDEQNPQQLLPRVSFAAARTKFLSDCEGRTKPRTVGEYRRLLQRHFNFEQDISDLTRHDIASVIEGIKSKPSEQHHAFVAVRTMMNWCVKRGFLDLSPVASCFQNLLILIHRPLQRLSGGGRPHWLCSTIHFQCECAIAVGILDRK
jgi:hypothetical protein